MKRLTVEVEIPTAQSIMNRHVLSFTPDMEVQEAVRRLVRLGYSGAPVVDESGQVVGVISEADCMRILATAAYDGWPEGTVGDHMQSEVDSVFAEVDVFTLASRFTDGTHRRFPVVDEDRKLVGIVTRRDIMRALDAFRHEQERVRLSSTYEMVEHRRRAG